MSEMEIDLKCLCTWTMPACTLLSVQKFLNTIFLANVSPKTLP